MDTPAKPVDRILVIDDDALMHELLLLLLGAEGHAVVTADSGDEALALLGTMAEAQLPSVILADLKMPGVSHAALAAGLRLACPPPAVMLAMSASEPVGDDALGFDAFLRKPFSIADYDAIVEQVRRQDAGEPAPGWPPAVDAGEGASLPALDETIFSRLFSTMGGPQLLQIYDMCLDDAAARTGRMTSAATVNDAVTFVREAHALKGGCGMLGAMELYSLAGRMEAGGLECSPLLDDFQSAFERLRRILEERIDRDVDERAES